MKTRSSLFPKFFSFLRLCRSWPLMLRVSTLAAWNAFIPLLFRAPIFVPTFAGVAALIFTKIVAPTDPVASFLRGWFVISAFVLGLTIVAVAMTFVVAPLVDFLGRVWGILRGKLLWTSQDVRRLRNTYEVLKRVSFLEALSLPDWLHIRVFILGLKLQIFWSMLVRFLRKTVLRGC